VLLDILIEEIVVLTSVTIRPRAHLIPNVPLTIVYSSVKPWYGLSRTSLQKPPSE
jgi:hypothetical protein